MILSLLACGCYLRNLVGWSKAALVGHLLELWVEALGLRPCFGYADGAVDGVGDDVGVER